MTVYLQLKDGFLLEAEIADTGVLPSEEEGPPNKTGVSQFLLDMVRQYFVDAINYIVDVYNQSGS